MTRPSGSFTLTDDADRFFVGADRDLFDGASFRGDVLWGTITIENDEGSWTRTLVGASDASAKGAGVSYIELVGAGAYEGLSAVIFEREADGWSWRGQILPGAVRPDR